MLTKLIRLFEVIHILLHRKGGLSYLISSGRSIASFGINESLMQIAPNLKTIIDVGANIGQYALATNRFFPQAVIHSFEPVPVCYNSLVKNTDSIERIHCHHCALGSQNTNITFYQNAHTHASSALKTSDFQKQIVPKTAEATEIKVDSRRLDDFKFNTNLEQPILLKLDVQGFEKEVLAGGKTFLEKVEYILIEMSFISMYENEPLFDEMHGYIKSLGFELLGPVGALVNTHSIIPQVDMLYRRKQKTPINQ